MAFELTLPVSKLNLTFRAPRGVDQQLIRQKFVDKKNRGPGESELLAAYCITHINGQPLMDPSPRHRMEGWDLVDVQFFQGVFVEMFYLPGEEWNEQVKATAQQIRDNNDHRVTLPASSRELTFKRPRNADRYAVLKMVSENEEGPQDIELLSAICVDTLNGEPANSGPQTTDPWELKDILFYQAVFTDLFFLTQASPESAAIKAAAKKLLSPDSEVSST